MKYIDADKLKIHIQYLIKKDNYELFDVPELLSFINSLQQEQDLIVINKKDWEAQEQFRKNKVFGKPLQQEQPEYGYLSTEYIHGKKSRWNVGDVLAYYISTSNEEGEYLLGKIVNVEFDEEEGWVYTFEDEVASDEQSLVEEGAYTKN